MAIEDGAKKGCDYLEFDNVNVFENQDEAKMTISDSEMLGFLKFLADTTKEKRSSITGKPVIPVLKNMWTTLKKHPVLSDWFGAALSEECCEYQQCEDLKIFTDKCKPVWIAEYGHARKTDKDSPFKGQYFSGRDVQKCCQNTKDMFMSVLFVPKELNSSKYFSCHDDLAVNSWSEAKRWEFVGEYCKTDKENHECKRATPK